MGICPALWGSTGESFGEIGWLSRSKDVLGRAYKKTRLARARKAALPEAPPPTRSAAILPRTAAQREHTTSALSAESSCRGKPQSIGEEGRGPYTHRAHGPPTLRSTITQPNPTQPNQNPTRPRHNPT
eukprot:gene25490-biopygen9037